MTFTRNVPARMLRLNNESLVCGLRSMKHKSELNRIICPMSSTLRSSLTDKSICFNYFKWNILVSGSRMPLWYCSERIFEVIWLQFSCIHNIWLEWYTVGKTINYSHVDRCPQTGSFHINTKNCSKHWINQHETTCPSKYGRSSTQRKRSREYRMVLIFQF